MVCFCDVQMMTSPAEEEEGYGSLRDAKCHEGGTQHRLSVFLFMILLSTALTLKFEAEGRRVLGFSCQREPDSQLTTKP